MLSSSGPPLHSGAFSPLSKKPRTAASPSSPSTSTSSSTVATSSSTRGFQPLLKNLYSERDNIEAALKNRRLQHKAQERKNKHLGHSNKLTERKLQLLANQIEHVHVRETIVDCRTVYLKQQKARKHQLLTLEKKGLPESYFSEIEPKSTLYTSFVHICDKPCMNYLYCPAVDDYLKLRAHATERTPEPLAKKCWQFASKSALEPEEKTEEAQGALYDEFNVLCNKLKEAKACHKANHKLLNAL